MDTEYLVKMKVVLEPVDQPWVTVDVNGHGKTQQLTQITEFDIDFYASAGPAVLTIEHFKKAEHDIATAVIIQKINFFGIEDQRFIWSGIYRPDYPAHYPDKVAEITNTTYLGWNGTWQLDFGVPVFEWIHRLQDLGWIYQ